MIFGVSVKKLLIGFAASKQTEYEFFTLTPNIKISVGE